MLSFPITPGLHSVLGVIDVGFASVHRVKEWDKGLRLAAIVADSDFNRDRRQGRIRFEARRSRLPEHRWPQRVLKENGPMTWLVSPSGTTDGEVKLVRGIFFEPGHLQLVGSHPEQFTFSPGKPSGMDLPTGIYRLYRGESTGYRQ